MRVIDQINAAASNPLSLLLTATDNRTKQEHGAALRVKIRKAKRYYVDMEATAVATNLGIEHPDILNELLKKARPPQETIWIEWHNRTAIEESGEHSRDDAPEFIGCFVETVDPFYPIYRITLAGTLPDSNKVVVSPLSYVYRTDDEVMAPSRDLPFLMEATGYDEDFFKRATVGTAYLKARKKIKTFPENFIADQRMANFMNRCTTELTPLTANFLKKDIGKFAENNHVRDYLRSDVLESAGTWRFIVSILALIAARDYVQTTPSVRKNKTLFVSGKMVPNVEHQIVALKLPRKIVLQRMVKACQKSIAIGKRQHDVDGYWCTSHMTGSLDCNHSYKHETPNRQKCIICGNKRWHVKGHKRGNPQIGIIFRDRQIMISD